MSFSSSLSSASIILVADTSVAINLNATGFALDILRAHPGSFVLTENAFAELTKGSRNGHRDAEQLQAFIDAGVIRLSSLGDVGSDIYSSLIEGSASRTLDDGEAATIAHACEVGGIALIDERKARSLCESQFPKLVVSSTIELLVNEAVRDALGQQQQVDAIVNALKKARMRVPSHQVDRVIGLIGEETAKGCNSLPRRARVIA